MSRLRTKGYLRNPVRVRNAVGKDRVENGQPYGRSGCYMSLVGEVRVEKKDRHRCPG